MNKIFEFIIQSADFKYSIKFSEYMRTRTKFVENTKIFKMRDNNNESFFR